MILTLTLTNERENKMTNTNNTIQKAYNNYSEVVKAMNTQDCDKADDSWVELTTLFTESLTEAQKKRFVDSDLIEQLDMIECSL